MKLILWFTTCRYICGASVAYQLGFQDPATTTMEGILLLNIHLLFVILGIVIVIAWLIYSILITFTEFNQSSVSNFVHFSIIEIVWTILPGLVLFNLSLPSFSLLYSLDETSYPELALKITGHQWYWSYEIKEKPCGISFQKPLDLKYSSYILSEEYIKENNRMGFFRNLETNQRIFLPIDTHIRLLITAVDVLHSWTIPSFGVKVDACPGRLNQANLFIKRVGLYFGQCSEICGVNHGFMPITLLALPALQFHTHVSVVADPLKAAPLLVEPQPQPAPQRAVLLQRRPFLGITLRDLLGCIFRDIR